CLGRHRLLYPAQSPSVSHVRLGSLADIAQSIRDVRFTPVSRHVQRRNRCTLCAINGHCGVAGPAKFTGLAKLRYSPGPLIGDSFSITESRLNDAGLWRMGNSLKLSNQFATNAWAGTWTKARSTIHLS